MIFTCTAVQVMCLKQNTYTAYSIPAVSLPPRRSTSSVRIFSVSSSAPLHLLKHGVAIVVTRDASRYLRRRLRNILLQ